MYVGVDLGGTKIAAAIVTEEGEIIKRVHMPTKATEGPDAVVNGIITACEALLENETAIPTSIGIGVPGQVRDDIGVVVFTPNLPLKDIYMAKELNRKYDCPIHLGNDANCAALGEVVSGGAKGAKDVVMITLGTGLGGGIIIGGKLHTGLSGAGGELGHMVIIAGGRECNCGRRGCWEVYAAATGLKNTALEYMVKHSDSMMWDLCVGMVERLDGRTVFDAYRAADPAAVLTVEQYTEHLAIGIVNMINILEPEVLCVGGGVSNAWDCLEEPLKAAVELERFTRFSTNTPQTRIVKASLGNDAGIIGAAMLGREGV